MDGLSIPPALAHPMYQEIVREKLLVLVKDLAMDGLSGYFRLPVRESEAPNYSALVKHPADLDSIANRIMYETPLPFLEIVAHLMRIFSNACVYNPPDSAPYANAVRLAENARLALFGLCQELVTLLDNSAEDSSEMEFSRNIRCRRRRRASTLDPLDSGEGGVVSNSTPWVALFSTPEIPGGGVTSPLGYLGPLLRQHFSSLDAIMVPGSEDGCTAEAVVDEPSTGPNGVDVPVRRGRGRPKGSGNSKRKGGKNARKNTR